VEIHGEPSAGVKWEKIESHAGSVQVFSDEGKSLSRDIRM